MTPYIILLLLTVLFSYIGRKSGTSLIRRFYLAVVLLMLVLFAGFRNVSVGTDTGAYVADFNLITSSDFIWRTTEIGYNSLAFICSSISSNYTLLLTSVALISIVCYSIGLIRLTKRYETAFFLFFTMGFFTFIFNGARQSIALSIFVLALSSLLNRRLVSYLFLVVLAASFHHTALFAIPLYFLAIPRVGFRQLLYIFIAITTLVLTLRSAGQFIELFFSDKYTSYTVKGESGGSLMVSYLLVQGFILYLLRHKIYDPKRKYLRLLNIYLIGLVPASATVLAGVNPSGLLRISMYASSTSMVLWPMVFYGIKDDSIRFLSSVLFLIFFITFFYFTTISFSQLVPYSINRSFDW